MASPAPASAAKICVACNADVSNAPRVKNPQGKYYCQECASKLQAGQQVQQPRRVASASAAVAAASDDVMAKIIAEATAKTANLCPGCQHPYQAGARICTSCGMNFELGKKAQTKVMREVREQSVKSSGGISQSVAYQFVAYSDFGLAIVAGVPLLLTAPLFLIDKDLFGLFSIVLVFTSLACLILTTIDAFKMSVVHGIGVLASFFVFSGLYMLAYAFFITETPRLRWLNVVFLVGVLTAVGLLYGVPELKAAVLDSK